VLDRLAGQGLRLTQGYSNSAVCSPTRVALITGRYQQRLRVGLEEPIAGPTPGARLPEGHPTLPSLLKRAGYRTALVGKWHVGFDPAAGPLDHGYDHFFGFLGGAANYYNPPPAPGAEPSGGLVLEREPVHPPGYLTDQLGDEAVRWIGRGTGPFFLSLHFSAPHWPWVAPGEEAAAAAWNDNFDRDRGSLEIYARMVRSLDDNIGKVLRALERSGAARDTIVVFTSDNGGERFSDMWPFTGVKGELLEGGIRVPLILRWPGRIAAGRTSEQVMISMDFLPTLLAAAGAAPDPGFPSDGENLLPVLAGTARQRPRRLFWRFRNAEQAAVRDGDWKYLKLGGREYLFDLSRDVRERANRKDAEPARFAALKEAFAAWNATMLPYPERSYSYDVQAIDADRY
jgi:arylsulfatase A-like enzyme